MKNKPYRFDREDHRDLNRLVNKALFVDDGHGYQPPFVVKRDGLFEFMGTDFWVCVGGLVRQNHVTDAIQKISIQTMDWSWDGTVRVTIHNYDGGGKKYHRYFDLAETGLLSGDETKFARDVILLRMSRD